MRRYLGLALTLGTLVAAAGCGDSSATGLVVGGSGTLVVTVSSGTTPTYVWSGGQARRLTVTQNGGGMFWDIEALNANGFAPPVTHGVVPNTARENSNEVPLVQGTDYRVSVTLVDGTEGTRVFRP